MWYRCIALTLMLVGVASAAPLKWESFQSPEGRFVVSSFGQATTRVNHESSPIGGIDEHTFIWTQNGFECDLAYTDVPSLGTLAGGKILFNQLTRGFQHRTKEPVANLRDWSLDGNPGRAFEFHQPKTSNHIAQCGTVRAVLFGSRFYVLIVTWDRQQLPSSQAEADRFLGSFKVLPSELR